MHWSASSGPARWIGVTGARRSRTRQCGMKSSGENVHSSRSNAASTCASLGVEDHARPGAVRLPREAAGIGELRRRVDVEVDLRHRPSIADDAHGLQADRHADRARVCPLRRHRRQAARASRNAVSSGTGRPVAPFRGAALPRGAGDVEMRPPIGLRVARQEARGGDAAARVDRRCSPCRRSWTSCWS